MSKTKITIALVAVVLFFIAGYFGSRLKPEKAFGKNSAQLKLFGADVIGTRTGTSTPVGVCFACANNGPTATTSYVSFIGQQKSTAVYNINIQGVSTTPMAQFDIQGSNDYRCDTTATSTTDTSLGGDEPLVSEIQWYGIDNLRNAVYTNTLTSGSSTAFVKYASSALIAGTTDSIVLTELNYNCLKLNVKASSTMMYASLTTR